MFYNYFLHIHSRVLIIFNLPLIHFKLDKHCFQFLFPLKYYLIKPVFFIGERITAHLIQSHKKISFEKQIRSVVQAPFFKQRLLLKVKWFLSFKNLELMAHAFITSQLDFSNSLYVRVNQTCFTRLQLVQNPAAHRIPRGMNILPQCLPPLTGFLFTTGSISEFYCWLTKPEWTGPCVLIQPLEAPCTP